MEAFDLGLLVLVIFIWVYYASIQILVLAYRSKSWPTSEGIVIESFLEEKTDNDGTTYRARLKYEYKVNGSTFSCNNISFEAIGSLEQETATRYIEKYCVDDRVKVYYNPLDKYEAVLIPGIGKQQMPTIRFVVFASLILLYLVSVS